MTSLETVTDKRRWWKEVLFILGFYLVYARIRNQFGSNGLFAATTTTAADNARRIIDLEKKMGLFLISGGVIAVYMIIFKVMPYYRNYQDSWSMVLGPFQNIPGKLKYLFNIN